MADKVRLALVGLGSAARVQYVPAVRLLKNGVVAAICDQVEDARKEVSRWIPEAKQFEDYDELLASDEIDAVILLTPTGLHAEHAVKAAAAGKHMLVEKPIATSLAECDQMIEAAERAGVIFQSGFMKRFDKSLQHVKNAIEDGSLGEIHTVLVDWRGRVLPQGVSEKPGPRGQIQPWRTQLGAGGGQLADHGVHTIDVARWWLGDVALASGEFAIVGDSVLDNQAIATLVHENGARSTHMFGHTHERWHESYQIDGTEGTMIVSFKGASHTTTQPFKITRYTQGGRVMTDETLHPHWSIDVEFERYGRYLLQMESFCEAIAEGRPPAVTGLDGRKAQEAVSAAYLSSFTGRRQRLPLEESPDVDAMLAEVKQAGGIVQMQKTAL